MLRIKLGFFLVFAILSGTICAQFCISHEQVALSYFVEIILPEQSTMIVEKIKFEYQTEAKLSFFENMGDCFNKDASTQIGLYKAQLSQSSPVRKKLALSNNLRVKKSSKWKLRVFDATKFEGYYYVRVDLVKLKSYMNTYFIKIGEHGCVEDWCLTGKIW